MSEKLQQENEEILGTPEELAKEVIKESEGVDTLKDLIVILPESGLEATEVLFADEK